MADKLLDILSNQGWHITKEGYDQITDGGVKNDLKVITQLLLDTDIKDYGKAILNTSLNNFKLSKIVLQIQKIKNISAPKSNQDSQGAPRMLKLIVTDGHNYCQALETDHLPFLNHNQTPPGSKLLIKNADVISGYIILNENSCILLGGKVPSLYEKWEINKSVAKHTRAIYDGEGPPPWVSFGRKIQSSTNNQSFKSLDNKARTKESSEFDVQRQDAIAEVSTGAVRKVFGGGIKQQHSQTQNVNQLREKKTQNYKEKVREKKVNKKELKSEEKLQKPPEKVSLFDFLEDKLPPSEELPIQQTVSNVEDVKPVKSGYKYNNNEKTRYNQPRNTYPVQQNNRYHQQNYNYNQGQSFNSNYQQNRGNQFNYSNTQQNNYKQQNTQYPTQYDNNKINENKFWNEFQQMSISTPKTPENPPNVNKNPNDRNTDRASLNSEFASRSLRQYLNIQPNKQRSSPQAPENTKDNNRVLNNFENSGTPNQIVWKIGDQCMAKYWEDNKFYGATITALTNRTCVVQFNDYGNIEEILQCDCLPIKNSQQEINKDQTADNTDFRKGGSRFYNSNNRNYGKPRY